VPEESLSGLVLQKGQFMWRFLCAGAIGITLLAGRPVLAQGPKSKDSVQKLQAELDALKMLIKDVEARLEKVRSETEKKPGFAKGKGKGKGKGDFGPPGKGKGDFGPPGKGKGKVYGKGTGPKPGEFGKPGYGPRGYGRGYGRGEYGWRSWRKSGEFGRGGYRPPDRHGDRRDVSNAEILRTLHQILREIEDLRRLIRRK
jgi:hypothetical protein